MHRLFRLLSGLPLGALHGLGVMLGSLLYLLPNRERRNARINIDLCFPDLSEGQKAALLKNTLIENAKTLLEMPSIWLADAATWTARIQGKTDVADVLRGLLREGKGVIIAGPHLGSWELAGLVLAQIAPVVTLYRPPRMEALESLMLEGRSRTGAMLVPTDVKGVRELYHAVKRANLAVILPDQQPKSSRGAVFAPFFDVPALTMELISRLARKSGAPVVFYFVERLPRSGEYRAHLIPAPAGIDDADPLIAATALNKGIEACVRRCPEQYQWTYKRFGARPDGGVTRYAGSK